MRTNTLNESAPTAAATPEEPQPQLAKVRIGITAGDMNGVGYELILKVFENEDILDLCLPIVYGSQKVAAYHRKVLGLSTNFQSIASAEEAVEGRLNLVDVTSEELMVELGEPSAQAGALARTSLERAVGDYKAGLFDVLVTAPINKASIQSADFDFPGHTDFLDARFGGEGKALMMLVSQQLRIALVTSHLPLAEVPAHITPALLEQKIRQLADVLQHDFLLSMPRIAVLGLNPHNGDGGLLGKEEEEVIRPTVKQLADEGLNVFGPYPADGFFGAQQWQRFDAVLAMYHDQGLAPFKALAMERGVNFTL